MNTDMISSRNHIVMIQRDLLHPHPDNPRKDLGDLSELRNSILEHGIMQNLTIVPDKEGYKILIGHRRYAASDGILNELPCVIAEGLSDREQVGIMLVENIQRSDLSFVEQAHGFQMMMDLGETVESISQKTGFSEKTVKHRLEIAKLSDKAINQKREWQLSIGDLIELEKIPNVKEREKILKDSADPMNLRYKVRMSVQERTINKNLDQAKKWFKELGIKEDANASMWSSDVERVREIEIKEENPKDLTYENLEKLLKKNKDLFWQSRYGGYISLFKKKKKEKQQVKKTAAELEREAKLKKRREIEHYGKEAALSYGHFILELPKSDWKQAAELKLEAEAWKFMVKGETGVASYHFAQLIENYEERQTYWNEVFPTLPMLLQMLLLLVGELIGSSFLDWNYRFDKETIELHKFMIECLKPLGYSLPEVIPPEIFDYESDLYSLFIEDQKEDEETDDEEEEGDE